jgi:hypothetical protein
VVQVVQPVQADLVAQVEVVVQTEVVGVAAQVDPVDLVVQMAKLDQVV